MQPSSRSRTTKFVGKAKKHGSWLRTFVEFVLFVCWLAFTGIGGYFIGHSPVTRICPPDPSPDVLSLQSAEFIRPKCIPTTDSTSHGVGTDIGAVYREGGYTFGEIKTMWKCSQAVSNFSAATDRIFPAHESIGKTKWQSIISVEPKAFFDKYLSQVILLSGDITRVTVSDKLRL